jgi:short-subunit dehydrogenase|tara:strand:- start:502 stop:1185 length:684 start_codon:yes stop_codon:yes gene_type:complete
VKKKKILITGTSSGLGNEIVSKLLNNYQIIGSSRKLGKAKKFVKRKNFSYEKLDLSKSNDIIYSKKFKNIYCLINNASLFELSDLSKIGNEKIIEIINTNLIGTILLTKKILKDNNKTLKKIINIISVSGLHGIKNQTIYSASKHGLKGFFNSLSQELINKNISITNLYPGGINTELWNKFGQKIKSKNKFFLKKKEVANLVEYIIKSENTNMIIKEIVFFPKNDWH